MTDPVIWPRGILVPRECNADKVPMTVVGPPALSGFQQAVSGPAARWRISYKTCSVHGRHRLTWRALQAQVDGRATPIVLPVYMRDELRLLGVSTAAGSTYGDGAAHGDGTGLSSSRSQVVLAADLARGAVTASVSVVLGPAPSAGQDFSIGHRLYRISRIVSVSGSDAVVGIWPPAREAAITGSELEFDRPVCRVKLADDMGLALDLDLGLNGQASVSFLEDAF